MRRLLTAALVAAVAGCAHEAVGEAPAIPVYTHEQEHVTIRLMPSPCVDPTSVLIVAVNFPPEMHARFRHIDSNWAMRDGTRRDFQGCWIEIGEELFLIFSDATGTRISKEKFRQRKGALGT